MQNPNSYYAVPNCDGGVWADWRHSERTASCSWASSSSTTLQDASYSRRSNDPTQCSAIPISYTLTPPTPDSTDSDVSSSSRLSMESIPEFDDMPEIPFVSAQVAYADEWIPSSHCPAEQGRIDESCYEVPSFWSSIVRLRPSASKSSLRSSSGSAVFGQTTVRSLSPSRASRKRLGSVSSLASSRTKPPPAKSILSSGSSLRTRAKAPSVKFLDMPTIHYDEGYPCDFDDDHDGDGDGDGEGATGHGPGSGSSMSPPPAKKAKKALGGILSLRWLFGPSKVENRTLPATPARPAISGPYPLWDSPSRRVRGPGGAASLRSVKSSGSLRSVRSCGSRLPTYWPR
ncbi:hypothetical protein BD414DRAFT_515869 [Trametes punicea]|nr:hypothetical protein BD414DRAFT_515869 [Trametes punicea]